MREQIITFETAKLAKEKGFDIMPDKFFDEGLVKNTSILRMPRCSPHTPEFNYQEIDIYYAPTQALLQKWLREVQLLHIVALPSKLDDGKWYYHRFDLSNLERDSEPELVDTYDTYEEALELGLQIALKLI